MKPSALAQLAAAQLLRQTGTLIVLRNAGGLDEPMICVAREGIVAYCGHVDLGTGLRTALTQIVAEELDVAAENVEMVLGDTARSPDQGATIASDSIQTAARPLRAAAAQARAALLDLAARHLAEPVADLLMAAGRIALAKGGPGVTFGDLIGDASIRLALNDDQPVKAVADYRLVGRSQPRIDILAKATGQQVFVQDVRVAGMLHGRVVRPPYAGVDHGPFVGTSLLAVDRESIAHIAGVIAVVVEGDFIGIVAERESQAATAADALKVEWKPTPTLPDLEDLASALRANPSTPRRLAERGDLDAALAGAATRLTRRYVWPYQLHASIGPSCSLADVRRDSATIWSGTQNPHELRTELARLLDFDVEAVEVIRMEAAGCYGRNCADDVCADAALLSKAVGRPVRVQLTRAQEHQWEPKGAAQLIEVDGALDDTGGVTGYDFQSRYPSNTAPTLALLLTGRVPPVAPVIEMGDRTSVPPYDYPSTRVTIHDMPPIVRASWLRGVSALPNVFAHESWIDEAAAAARVDPIEYRLRYLVDPRGRDLVRQTALRAGWQPHATWGAQGGTGDILQGRGFAYALYKHGKFPGSQAAWSAWVADVEVNRVTGEVVIARITNGHDAGLMINPAGVQHQIHGNVIQSVSRAMREAVPFKAGLPVAREWGSYPIITFTGLPQIDTLMIERFDQPPLGAGESASVPSAAAIANAIYDACGVRCREPPFTADKIRAGLGLMPQLAAAGDSPRRKARPWRALVSGVSLSLAGLAALIFPWRSAIAPIERVDPSLYSAATVNQGRLLAAVGDCAVCHTATGGLPNVGGRPLATPFGIVYSTNITPDPETGIGNWSYDAFQRAMRFGVHRDGRHLYPVFPYTHFTQTSEHDLQALYAYLMAQESVTYQPPATKLAFPFNLRLLMAGWNALFLRPGALAAVQSQSDVWNRGRYLVEGLGHCAACHSPRNLAAAEAQGGDFHLTGGWADGWEAPALARVARAPVPWDKPELYAYLRTGYSALHGSAAGPMAPVVHELSALPDEDIDAMATYLASFSQPLPDGAVQALAASQEARSARAIAAAAGTPGADLYAGACAGCHQGGDRSDVFGIVPSLTLNSNLHADSPDNVVRVVLQGVSTTAVARHGAMPAFAGHLNDDQMSELVTYLRASLAPERGPWNGIRQAVRRIRAEGATTDESVVSAGASR